MTIELHKLKFEEEFSRGKIFSPRFYLVNKIILFLFFPKELFSCSEKPKKPKISDLRLKN